ncbi:hypothetical protein AJ88_33205 [Mesorhizobium amorphae CCBAU 01583]|nr:hypothetical protein AJ88_33205 [Mesorhizobium amorphae CCBAU 01583]
MPRLTIVLDIDRARLLGEQAAKDKPTDAGGNTDADFAVMMMAVGGRGLDGAGQRAAATLVAIRPETSVRLNMTISWFRWRGDPSAS